MDKRKRRISILIAVAILCAGCIGGYFLLRPSDETKPESTSVESSQTGFDSQGASADQEIENEEISTDTKQQTSSC